MATLRQVLKDNSVTFQKTAFFSAGKNLFDKSVALQGYYVSNTNGSIEALSGYYASDYMSVKPNTIYARNSNQLGAFYDSAKQFISGITNSGGTVTTPSNAAYVRLSVTAATIDTFQFEEGSVSTSYEPYGWAINKLRLLNSNIPDSSITNAKLAGPIPSIPTNANIVIQSMAQVGKNLFDKTDITANRYLDDTGALVILTGFNVSGFIPVSPNTTYIRNTKSNGFDNYYDSNKAVIGRVSNTLAFTTPSNAAYVRLTVTDAGLNILQLEVGTVSTAYESYGISLAKLKVNPENIPLASITADRLADTSFSMLRTNFLYKDPLFRRNGLVYSDNLKTNGFDFSWYTKKNGEKIVITLPTGTTSVSFNFQIKDAGDLAEIENKGLIVNFDITNLADNNVTGLCEIKYNETAVVDNYAYNVTPGSTANMKTTYVPSVSCTSATVKFLFSYNAADEGKTIEISNFIIYTSATDLGFNTLAALKASLYPIIKLEESRHRWYGKKLVVLGDSITYLENSYLNIMKGLVYFNTVVNAGVPGTTVAHVSTGDNCFVDRVASLDTDADMYIIFGTTNDYIGGIPIGTIGNGNNGTVIGAYQTIIETILNANKKADIRLITMYPMDYKGTIDTPNNAGLKIIDYVNATKNVAAHYNLKCLDLFNTGGVNSINVGTLLTDKVHPTFDFGYILARQVNAFIESV